MYRPELIIGASRFQVASVVSQDSFEGWIVENRSFDERRKEGWVRV